MNTATERRKGFESPYKQTYEYGWDLKHLGFDYSNVLLEKTMSNYMFKNTRLGTFLKHYLNPIFVFFINRVKFIRIFYNYAVPKDYQKIN